MYLRAPERTSSRCSAMVSLVICGTSDGTSGIAGGASGLSSTALSITASGTIFFTRLRCLFLPSLSFLIRLSLFFIYDVARTVRRRRTLAGVYTHVSQMMHHLLLDFFRVVHLVNNQISDVGLHNYCTKVKQGLL